MRPLSLALVLALAPAVLPAQHHTSARGRRGGARLQPARRHPLRRPGEAGPALRLQGEDGGARALLQGPNQGLNRPNERVRDQYATLFKDGRGVVLIAISADPDTALASWARDSEFPFLFASDSALAVARQYGAVADVPGLTNPTCSWWGRTGGSVIGRSRSRRSIRRRTRRWGRRFGPRGNSSGARRRARTPCTSSRHARMMLII